MGYEGGGGANFPTSDDLQIFSRVHATLHPALSVHRSVGPSVGRSVGRSVGPSVTLYFFGLFKLFGLTAPAQMLR